MLLALKPGLSLKTIQIPILKFYAKFFQVEKIFVETYNLQNSFTFLQQQNPTKKQVKMIKITILLNVIENCDEIKRIKIGFPRSVFEKPKSKK